MPIHITAIFELSPTPNQIISNGTRAGTGKKRMKSTIGSVSVPTTRMKYYSNRGDPVTGFDKGDAVMIDPKTNPVESDPLATAKPEPTGDDMRMQFTPDRWAARIMGLGLAGLGFAR